MWSFKSGQSSRQQFFDFDKAVEEARRDFPEETRDLTIINLDDPNATRQIRQWEQALDRDSLQALYEGGALKELTPQSAGVTITAPYTRQKLIAIHARDNGDTPFFPGEPLKQAAFALFHELGHVVVKHDSFAFDPMVNKGESAADVFAIIRGYQKGIFDKKDAKHIADARLGEALSSGGFDHLTTMSVDALIINPRGTDLKSLSPREAAAVAKAHADSFGNDERSEHNLTTVFNGASYYGLPSEKTMLRNLVNIAVKTGKDSHEFYIAARALLPIFQKYAPEKLERAFGAPYENIKKVWDTVAQKAAGRDIGAVQAVANASWSGSSTAAAQPDGFVQRLKNWLKPAPLTI